ncbi:MAG: type VI secretion system accessory protein TagJ [Pirellula sp.]
MSSSSIQWLRNADLQSSLKSLQAEVRDNPSDPKHRIFLFQLLSIMGQWDRALNQLNVLRELSAESLSLAQTYQETLNCEALRHDVFAGKRSPLLFGEPESWMALIFESLKISCQEGKAAEASTLRSNAFEDAPTTSGTITLFPAKSTEDDKNPPEVATFEWIADADSRIGPFLEAIINGKYFWVPFQRIRTISLEKVADLRDLVWLPARFEWSNGGETVGFVPTRYPGSETQSDDQVRMGWKTIWNPAGQDTFVGLGQRILATDVDEYPLTKIAKIELSHE